MADYAALGKLVKQKYPQYASIDDALLGEKIAAKYPEYAKQFGGTTSVTPYSGSTPSSSGISILPPTPSETPVAPSVQPVAQPTPNKFKSLDELNTAYNTEVDKITAYYDRYITDSKVDDDTKKEAIRQKQEKLARAKEIHTQQTDQYTAEKKETGSSTDLISEMKNVADKLVNRDTSKITSNPATLGLNRIGAKIPGTEGKMTQALYEQLKNLLSLENIKYLKGQGQVSDAERALLEKASSALSTDLSNEDFKSLLGEIKGTLDKKITPTGTTPAVVTQTGLPQKPTGIYDKIQKSKEMASAPVKDVSTATGLLPAISGALMPHVVSYAKNNLQELGAGNLTPEAGKSKMIEGLGPIGSLTTEKGKAGAEMANATNMARGVSGGIKGGIDYLGAAGRSGSINPVNVSSQLRKEAVQAFNNAGGDITKAKEGIQQVIKNYTTNINPSKEALQQSKEMLLSLKNNKTLDDILTNVSGWQGRGYGLHGPKTTEVPQMLVDVSRGARDVIKDVAPDVAKYTKDIGKAIGTNKEIGKAIGKATMGLVPSAPGYFWLFDTLKKKLSGQ